MNRSQKYAKEQVIYLKTDNLSFDRIANLSNFKLKPSKYDFRALIVQIGISAY